VHGTCEHWPYSDGQDGTSRTQSPEESMNLGSPPVCLSLKSAQGPYHAENSTIRLFPQSGDKWGDLTGSDLRNWPGVGVVMLGGVIVADIGVSSGRAGEVTSKRAVVDADAITAFCHAGVEVENG